MCLPRISFHQRLGLACAREIGLMRPQHHPNIVRLVDVVVDASAQRPVARFYTDYCSLDKLLHRWVRIRRRIGARDVAWRDLLLLVRARYSICALAKPSPTKSCPGPAPGNSGRRRRLPTLDAAVSSQLQAGQRISAHRLRRAQTAPPSRSSCLTILAWRHPLLPAPPPQQQPQQQARRR